MELKTLYARRYVNAMGAKSTTLTDDTGKRVATYPENQKQPHRNKKKIVHNCFTYKLVWIN